MAVAGIVVQQRLVPASILALRGYTRETFASDLVAGVTVGLVALPLAMAFAISSGMPPQAGIYCAVVTGFIISALGGSKVQIGGPTGAFVVVVSGIVAQYGVDGLFMCTMMAGVLLVIMGLTGTGTAVRFIPRPVVIGFTNGIALVIASTQIKDFFGIALPSAARRIRPAHARCSPSMPARRRSTTAVVAPRRARPDRRVEPHCAARARLHRRARRGHARRGGAQLPVDTIGTRFGGIPSGLPAFQRTAVPAGADPDAALARR